MSAQQDDRSALEKLAWQAVGPPLYYCAQCLRAVSIDSQGQQHYLCQHSGGPIVAPRRATVYGVGTTTGPTRRALRRAKQAVVQAACQLTGRSIGA